MDIASKVIMLILMQSVIKAAATGCTISDATLCQYRYATLQTISPNQSVTFHLYNSTEYINKTLRWCLSGNTVAIKFPDTFTATERGTNLIYNNPYPNDGADGKTLYLVVDLVDDCTHPLRAVSINSLDGNFTEQYHILLHVDKVSPLPTNGPPTTTQRICYTSTISTTTVDATKCIQTNTPPADMGGASTTSALTITTFMQRYIFLSFTETKMAPDLSSTSTVTHNTSSVHQMETACITSLSASNTHSTAYPSPTSTPTVLGRREPIPEVVSLGAVLVIVLCLYALTTIILVLRIKLLRGNARQPQVDCTNGIVENTGSKEQEPN